MCSIEEAWGSQLSGKNTPDKPGQLYTQTDDRTQWAKPEFINREMAKSAPEANGFTRGVHSKYSREKRIDARQHDNQGAFSGLQSDVDSSYFNRDTNTKPKYLDLYEKPFEDFIGSNLGPQPANLVSEQFSQLHETFVHEPLQQQQQQPNIPASNNSSVPNNDNSKINTVNKKNMDNIAILQSQILALETKIQKLEATLVSIESDKSHDIILYIVIAIFVLFVLDMLFKRTSS